MWVLLRWLAIAGLGIAIMASDTNARDLENTIYLDLKDGRVVIEMRPDLAPKHVARIKELTREGFYDGLKWHRVIDGFMAQTGDPKGLGIGGSGKNIKAEFSSEPHVRGTLSMARAQNPDRRKIYRLGPGHRRHGFRRHDQEGQGPERAGEECRSHHPYAGSCGRRISAGRHCRGFRLESAGETAAVNQ